MLTKGDFRAAVRKRLKERGVPVALWNHLIEARSTMGQAYDLLIYPPSGDMASRHEEVRKLLEKSNDDLKADMKELLGEEIFKLYDEVFSGARHVKGKIRASECKL